MNTKLTTDPLKTVPKQLTKLTVYARLQPTLTFMYNVFDTDNNEIKENLQKHSERCHRVTLNPNTHAHFQNNNSHSKYPHIRTSTQTSVCSLTRENTFVL